jgi:hypothetical protein
MEEMQIQISTLLKKVDRVERLSGKEANSERTKTRFPRKESGPKAFATQAVAQTKSKKFFTREPPKDSSDDEEEQVEYANLAQMHMLYSPLTPGYPTYDSNEAQMEVTPTGTDSPRGSGVTGPSIFGPMSRAIRKDECVPTSSDDSRFRTLHNRATTAADRDLELRPKTQMVHEMETGYLRPSGGAHPLPGTTIGLGPVDDDARITLIKSHESPPPRPHLYKELIGKTCYEAPSPEMQLATPQDGDCPDLGTNSSDDAPIFMGRTSTNPQLSFNSEQHDLPQPTSKCQTRLRTRMESFILPEPFIPGEDGNGAQLNPRQPELGQDMEVDKDKPDELLERKVMRTPFLTVSMDHFEEQYVLRPYGLQAPQRLPPGYDMAAAEARFKEYSQAAVEKRFNESLRPYGQHSETTNSRASIKEKCDGFFFLADYRSRRGRTAVTGTTTASTRPPGGVSGCISGTSGQEGLA